MLDSDLDSSNVDLPFLDLDVFAFGSDQITMNPIRIRFIDGPNNFIPWFVQKQICCFVGSLFCVFHLNTIGFNGCNRSEKIGMIVYSQKNRLKQTYWVSTRQP